MKAALLLAAAASLGGASAIVVPNSADAPLDLSAPSKFASWEKLHSHGAAAAQQQAPVGRRDAAGGIKLPLYSHSRRDLNNSDDTRRFALGQAELIHSKWGNSTREEKRRRWERRQSVGLTGFDTDVSYYAQISIGTPAQNFVTILDTGSSDLWVVDTSCTSSQCSGSALFNPQSSSTYRGSDTAFQIQYGIGAVRGTLAADTVSLAGYSVQSQTFAIIDQLAQGTLRAPASALMGMGFQQLASSGATPFWQVLAQSNELQQPLFTFQLARNNQNPTVLNAKTLADQLQPGGVFTLGQLDSNQYEGDITYTSLTSRAYWTIPMDSISVDGRSTSLSSSNNVAAIDTGTTLVAGPPSVVRSIYEQIPGSVTAPMGGDDSSLYYAFPCSTSVQVSLTFSGKAWSINSADFNYGLYGRQGGVNYCLGAFFGTDLGQGAPDWIVGDAFLKNVFSVYESNPARVGFASLKGNTAQTLATTTGAIRQATATAAASTSAASGSSSSVVPAVLPSNSADNTASGNVGGSGLPAPTPGTTVISQTASLVAGAAATGNSSSGGSNASARSAAVSLSLAVSSLFLGALAVLL